MNAEFLYLFHSTLGTVRLRKRLELQPHAFRVCDVPRRLSAGSAPAAASPSACTARPRSGSSGASAVKPPPSFVVTKTVSIANWPVIRPPARAW